MHLAMTAIYSGLCLIRRYAFLDHPRFRAGSINLFIFDVVIAGSSYRSTDHLLYGTLRFRERDPGLYILSLTVLVPH